MRYRGAREAGLFEVETRLVTEPVEFVAVDGRATELDVRAWLEGLGSLDFGEAEVVLRAARAFFVYRRQPAAHIAAARLVLLPSA